MATLKDIEAGGGLVRIKVPLNHGEFEERHFYAVPTVVEWLDGTLPTLETMIAEGRMSPLEQADEFLVNFITGGTFICDGGRDLHEMRPVHRQVWELKTPDLRMIGWFHTPREFVCLHVDSKGRMEKEKNVNNIDLYEIYKNNVSRFRDQLDLDEPKSANEAEVKDELCS